MRLFLTLFSLVSTGFVRSAENLSLKPFVALRRLAVLSSALALSAHAGPLPVFAVSGGGKEFALKDLREQIFDNQNFQGKDFTQCDAASASFKGSNLKGTRFYRANLKDTDFSGADLTGASLEDTLLLGAKFENSLMTGAYLSQSILDSASIAGADFTDAQMPEKTLRVLCGRPDVSMANVKTGVVTSESLMCP